MIGAHLILSLRNVGKGGKQEEGKEEEEGGEEREGAETRNQGSAACARVIAIALGGRIRSKTVCLLAREWLGNCAFAMLDLRIHFCIVRSLSSTSIDRGVHFWSNRRQKSEFVSKVKSTQAIRKLFASRK